MSQEKNNKYMAGRIMGGALVALSGFVPQPSMQHSGFIKEAAAASIKIPVTAKLISGIKISNVVGLDFGSFVATNTTGDYGFKAVDGALLGAIEAQKVVAPTRGNLKITADVAADVDIKVSKVGTDLSLTGAGAAGDVTLKTIDIGAILNTGVQGKIVTAGGGVTTAKLTYAVTKTGAAKDVKLGATIVWNTTRPVGTISNTGGNIVFTVNY